jgi:hypothetical protein
VKIDFNYPDAILWDCGQRSILHHQMEDIVDIQIDKIELMIHMVRGQRVMLDSDLAKLYGVETGALNRQVKRNIERFPSDFMFQLSRDEHELLRCQIGISKDIRGGRRYQPLVFTENGVAMLSSVLSSSRAIQVNIAIMRTFTALRNSLNIDSHLKAELVELRKDTGELFKIVFEKMDQIEKEITPKLPKNRKKIGL